MGAEVNIQKAEICISLIRPLESLDGGAKTGEKCHHLHYRHKWTDDRSCQIPRNVWAAYGKKEYATPPPHSPWQELSLLHHKPQEGDRWRVEITFLRFDKKPILEEALEYQADMLNTLLLCLQKDENAINVDEDQSV